MAMLRTPGVPWVAVCSLLFALLHTPAIAAPSQPALSGLVKDGLGNALEGVRILVLPEKSAAPPVVEAWTAADGRFRVKDLEPGAYRVAAVKEGYLTFLGRINTLLRSSLDLVLSPLPSTSGPDELLPSDASWTLRLPGRSLLREVDGGSLIEEGDESRVESAVMEPSGSHRLVQSQFEQLFALNGGPEGSDEALEVLGSETRLSLAVPLRERANVVLRGYREHLRGASSEGGAPSARRDRAGLRVELGYDTSLDARLAVNAYYTQGSLGLPAPGQGTSGLIQQAQRTWGYEATYSKQLTDSSRFKVDLDYKNTSMELPALVLEGFQSSEVGGVANGVSNRMVGAGGSFESSAGQRHQVRVGVRAQMLDLPLPLLRTAGAGAFSGMATGAGWSLRLDAEDAWALSRPLTMVYGLGYEQNLHSLEPALVVPRAGAVWSGEGLRMRMVLSYHTSAQDFGTLPTSLGRPHGPSRSLGYDLTVEAPLPFGLQVQGSSIYEPVKYGFVGYEPGAFERPVYLNGGNVATRQDSLLLERQFDTTRAYFRLSRGIAEGTLAALSPLDAPVQVLGERALRFATGRVGVRMASSGTEVHAEYQKIEESLPTGPEISPVSSQEYLQVRVSQDLIWLEGKGASWKLLLAARTASNTAERRPSPQTAGDAALAMFRQISAGVAVAF